MSSSRVTACAMSAAISGSGGGGAGFGLGRHGPETLVGAAPTRSGCKACRVKILFIGDIVGKPGRVGLEAVMPELRSAHSPDLVIANGENVGRRARDHREDRERDLRRRRRRDHDRQPRLPPSRGVRVPRPGRARDPAGELHDRQPRPRPDGRRGGRAAGLRDQPQRHRRPAGGAVALHRGRLDHRPPRGARPTSSSSTSTPR